MAVNPWLDLGFRLDIHDLDTLNRSSVIKTWLTRISYNLGIYERSKVALGTMAVDTNMQSERRTFDISSLKPFFFKYIVTILSCFRYDTFSSVIQNGGSVRLLCS